MAPDRHLPGRQSLRPVDQEVALHSADANLCRFPPLFCAAPPPQRGGCGLGGVDQGVGQVRQAEVQGSADRLRVEAAPVLWGAFGDVVDEGLGAEFAQRFLEVRTSEAEHSGGALGCLLPGERGELGELGEITDAEVVHQLLHVLCRDL